jgi:hypothetical protein
MCRVSLRASLDASSAGELAQLLAGSPLHALSLDCDYVYNVPAVTKLLTYGLVGHATLQRLWLHNLRTPKDTGVYASRLLNTLLGDAPALSSLYMSGTVFADAVGTPSATLLDALARPDGAGASISAGGAPRLRHLSLPAAGLEALSAGDVRAAAPALRSLELRCVKYGALDEDAPSRWMHMDLLNETS